MRKMQWIFSVLAALFFMNTTQGQAPKKAKKPADGTEQTSAQDIAKGYARNKVDPSTIPDTYKFSWKYKMEIQSDKGKAMVFDYFLEPHAGYFGFNLGENQMFMIMDQKNKIMVTTFGQGKEKMASASKMADYSKMTEKEAGNSKFTYKTLPNKTILGFNCKGVQATSKEYVMVFYFTNEAKVSFADVFKSQQNQKIPDAFGDYFKAGEKPLMMSMNMKDVKKGQTTTMKCIGLEKNAHTFSKSDYKFM